MSAKDKILRAADTLFGELGFDATTTREIARRSGVNKALIYYHFKDKEDLFKNVLDQYYHDLGMVLQHSIQDNGDFRTRMIRLVDAYVDFLQSNLNFSRIVQRESSGGPHIDQIRQHLAPLFELGTTLIQEMYPETNGGNLSGPQLLISFYGMIVGYFTYSDVLEDMLGSNPLSQENLRMRKEHLHRMLNITLDAVQTSHADTPKG